MKEKTNSEVSFGLTIILAFLFGCYILSNPNCGDSGSYDTDTASE